MAMVMLRAQGQCAGVLCCTGTPLSVLAIDHTICVLLVNIIFARMEARAASQGCQSGELELEKHASLGQSSWSRLANIVSVGTGKICLPWAIVIWLKLADTSLPRPMMSWAAGDADVIDVRFNSFCSSYMLEIPLTVNDWDCPPSNFVLPFAFYPARVPSISICRA